MIELPNVDELMKKEMSRKDFLHYIGIAFLSMICVAAVLQNVQKSLGGSSHKTEVRQAGYGGTAYGR